MFRWLPKLNIIYWLNWLTFDSLPTIERFYMKLKKNLNWLSDFCETFRN